MNDWFTEKITDNWIQENHFFKANLHDFGFKIFTLLGVSIEGRVTQKNNPKSPRFGDLPPSFFGWYFLTLILWTNFLRWKTAETSPGCQFIITDRDLFLYQRPKSMVVSGSPKSGRWHIIPQLAVYTTYIPLIYCLLGGEECYRSHLLGEPEPTIDLSAGI